MLDATCAQRRRLLDTLERLDDAGWDTPSLCDGWRVREVIGHLTSTLETPFWKTMVNLVRYRGFDNWADRAARELAALPTADLLARYRSVAEARFAPPGIGPIAPLTDVQVHTRDIERPLGLASTLDPVAVTTSLGYVCGGRARGFIPAERIDALRFVADDVDWSIGTGDEVRGPAETILLAVCDRPQVAGELTGPGADVLRSRLAGA